MTLPLPSQTTAAVGGRLSAALWNSNVRDAVNFLLNPPHALLYQTSAQTIPNNAGTAVLLDTESYDTYNGHSTSSNTSRYVGKVAGTYLVIGQTSFAANATGLRAPEIKVNGSTLTPWPHPIGNTSASLQNTMQVASPVTLNGTTDYVEIYAFQNSGSNIALLTLQSWMYVVWLHA